MKKGSSKRSKERPDSFSLRSNTPIRCLLPSKRKKSAEKLKKTRLFTDITKRSNRLNMRDNSANWESKKRRKKNSKRWENFRRKLPIDNLKLMPLGPRELKNNRRETQDSVKNSSSRKDRDFWLTLMMLDLSNSKKDNTNLPNKQRLRKLNSSESSKIKRNKNKGKRGPNLFVVRPSCLIKRTWNCKSCRTPMSRSKVDWTTLKRADS